MTALEQQLFSALVAARDHLDYVGYGDEWERGCADSQGLPGKIEAAIKAGEAAGGGK